MTPADHIKIIEEAIHYLNKDGHILEGDQFVADVDVKAFVEKLKEAYYNLDAAVHRLGRTIEWHKDLKSINSDFDKGTSAGELVNGDD